MPGFGKTDSVTLKEPRSQLNARAVLKGEREVEMRRSVARKGKASKRRTLEGVDSDLFERLKAWRMAQARSQSVPPYVVFHDSTLSALAAAQPQDMDALAGIAGIGAKKLERYGTALLELLQDAQVR